MAAVQHPRTRSARLMANLTNKSTQQHAPAPSHPVTHGASALSLFLTNLRLLDLDLRPDWPGISADTFAASGTSAQGLKKRVQSVEWALYHLFELWDPEGTRNKLKPFFPPLDQVQSLNLRAALLRALEQAKKNGVLGRDAIVRKTMLDECRGERLEEVLAAFSSAVLKNVTSDDAAASGEHPSLALELALEDRGYKGERTELSTLALAHRVSLHALLRKKMVANSRYRDFSELLDVKERGMSRRDEAIRAKQQNGNAKTVSDDAKLEMWRKIRNNWSGNERWMETLQYGDAGSKKDGLFNMQFDRVWRRVQQGRLAEVEEQGSGLLEQLDTRVRVQKERLKKWEGFRKRMGEGRPAVSPSKKARSDAKGRGIDLGFGAHEGLQVGRASPRKAYLGTKKPRLDGEYADLISSLESELSRTEPKEPHVLAVLQRPRPANLPDLQVTQKSPAVHEAEVGSISDVSELDEDGLHNEPFPSEAPIKSFQAKLDNSKRLPIRPRISYSEDSYGSTRTSSRTSSGSRGTRKRVDDEVPNYCTTSSELDQSPELSRHEAMQDITLQQPPSPKLEDEIIPPPSPIKEDSPSPTQQLADQILESMNQASPSPTKRTRPRPTLSLAERTRMSMARGSLALPDLELDLPLSPTRGTVPSIVEDTTQAAPEEYEDLVSRTRKSMAGFDKARQKAQMERRRSLRKSRVPPRKEGSYFPKVEEDPDQTLLAEELMTVEDMEAVFRSRPKIKASPIASPTKEWEEDYA